MDVQVISVSLIKRQTADVPGPWIMNTPHDHNKVMKVPATRKQSTNSIHRPLLLACSTMQDGQTDATDTCSELADFPIPLCVVTVLCQAFCVSALQHMLTSRVANFHMTNPANKCLPTTIPQSAQTHLCQESNVDGDLQVCSHHGQGLARVVLQARRVMQTDRGVQPDGVASVSEETWDCRKVSLSFSPTPTLSLCFSACRPKLGRQVMKALTLPPMGLTTLMAAWGGIGEPVRNAWVRVVQWWLRWEAHCMHLADHRLLEQ
eukprot:1158358-Pelagomonas_calceolata.AAC.12